MHSSHAVTAAMPQKTFAASAAASCAHAPLFPSSWFFSFDLCFNALHAQVKAVLERFLQGVFAVYEGTEYE